VIFGEGFHIYCGRHGNAWVAARRLEDLPQAGDRIPPSIYMGRGGPYAESMEHRCPCEFQHCPFLHLAGEDGEYFEPYWGRRPE